MAARMICKSTVLSLPPLKLNATPDTLQPNENKPQNKQELVKQIAAHSHTEILVSHHSTAQKNKRLEASPIQVNSAADTSHSPAEFVLEAVIFYAFNSF